MPVPTCEGLVVFIYFIFGFGVIVQYILPEYLDKKLKGLMTSKSRSKSPFAVLKGRSNSRTATDDLLIVLTIFHIFISVIRGVKATTYLAHGLLH